MSARALPLEAVDHPDWPRANRWATRCLEGWCRYAGLPPASLMAEAPAVDSTTHCGGYLGSPYWDEGYNPPRIILRWRPCDRHLAWWRKRQEQIRAAHAAMKPTKKAKA